jgi:hypothetical protein
MMPQVIRVRVHSGHGRRIRLWIPVVPVLIVLSPLLLLAALVVAVASLAYRVNPARALAAGWRLMTALQGFRLDVEQGRTAVQVNII